MKKKHDPVSFWENRRVPRRYVKMFLFIESYRRDEGQSPTWSEIAEYMDWEDMDKLELRKVMRKGRAYGLKFELNGCRSTKIHGHVIPYLEERMQNKAAA
jgi:hypothetical protein